jgi:hypothetical protein
MTYYANLAKDLFLRADRKRRQVRDYWVFERNLALELSREADDLDAAARAIETLEAARRAGQKLEPIETTIRNAGRPAQ